MKGGGRGRRENGRMTPPWPSPSLRPSRRAATPVMSCRSGHHRRPVARMEPHGENVGIQTQSVLSGAARGNLSGRAAPKRRRCTSGRVAPAATAPLMNPRRSRWPTSTTAGPRRGRPRDQRAHPLRFRRRRRLRAVDGRDPPRRAHRRNSTSGWGCVTSTPNDASCGQASGRRGGLASADIDRNGWTVAALRNPRGRRSSHGAPCRTRPRRSPPAGAGRRGARRQ